jgi:hypothetical protein
MKRNVRQTFERHPPDVAPSRKLKISKNTNDFRLGIIFNAVHYFACPNTFVDNFPIQWTSFINLVRDSSLARKEKQWGGLRKQQIYKNAIKYVLHLGYSLSLLLFSSWTCPVALLLKERWLRTPVLVLLAGSNRRSRVHSRRVAGGAVDSGSPLFMPLQCRY